MSRRERRRSNLEISPDTYERRLLTSCARAWSSYRSSGGLLLEVGLVPAELVDVQDVLDVAQGGVEGLQLLGKVGSGHDTQDYAARPGRRPGGGQRIVNWPERS